MNDAWVMDDSVTNNWNVTNTTEWVTYQDLHTMFDILKNMRETKCDYWPGELEQYPENNWNTFILDGFPLLKLPFGVMSARPVHLW